MTERQMKNAIEIIRVEVDLIKELLNPDQRIFFDQQIDGKYRAFIAERPDINEEERLSVYEMFESVKMNNIR